MRIIDMNDEQKHLVIKCMCRFNCDHYCPLHYDYKDQLIPHEHTCLSLIIEHESLCLKEQATIDIDLSRLKLPPGKQQ